MAKPEHDRAAIPLAETTRPHRGIDPWTPEVIARLKALWVAGKSAGQIAADLSALTRRTITRNAVGGKIERLGLLGKGGRKAQGGRAKPAPATKPEKRADLSTGGAVDDRAKTSPVRPPAKPLIEIPSDRRMVQSAPNADELVQPDVVALFGVRTDRVTREPGTYRIDELGTGQCRYACNVAPKGGVHLFCGARARVQPGKLHGSWCDAHLAVVWAAGTSCHARKRA